MRIGIGAYGCTTVYDTALGTWIASKLLQEAVRPNGPKGKIDRTHVYKPGLGWDEETSYLGGAEMTMKAVGKVATLYPTAEIAIIGARPPSMERRFPETIEQGFTEAQTMLDTLPPDLIARGRVLIDPNALKNTEGDTNQMLQFAADKDLTLIIMPSFRYRRCVLLRDVVVKRNPALAEVGKRVMFLEAEQFLPEDRAEFERMRNSAAWTHTMFDEDFGSELLLKQLAA